MNYIHREVNVGSDEIVQVTLDKQANVRLMDDDNYQKYRSGQKHKYHGGRAKSSPAYIKPPRPGHWHLVIDLGGYPGNVSASVDVERESLEEVS